MPFALALAIVEYINKKDIKSYLLYWWLKENESSLDYFHIYSKFIEFPCKHKFWSQNFCVFKLSANFNS